MLVPTSWHRRCHARYPAAPTFLSLHPAPPRTVEHRLTPPRPTLPQPCCSLFPDDGTSIKLSLSNFPPTPAPEASACASFWPCHLWEGKQSALPPCHLSPLLASLPVHVVRCLVPKPQHCSLHCMPHVPPLPAALPLGSNSSPTLPAPAFPRLTTNRVHTLQPLPTVSRLPSNVYLPIFLLSRPLVALLWFPFCLPPHLIAPGHSTCVPGPPTFHSRACRVVRSICRVAHLSLCPLPLEPEFGRPACMGSPRLGERRPCALALAPPDSCMHPCPPFHARNLSVPSPQL